MMINMDKDYFFYYMYPDDGIDLPSNHVQFVLSPSALAPT